MDDGDDDDEDLEAELAALTAGNVPRRPAPRKRNWFLRLILYW